MAWSQTIISTSLNMSGGFSGGALDSSVVTLTVASGAGILSGAYFIAGDVPCSISVRSGNNLTAVTQARVRIPPIANGTPLTIYNPITQSGTDDGSTGANLAFSGLAGFPSTIINCFSSAASISTALVDVSGGAQIGATTIVVDNGSGQPPAIIPPVLGRFTIGSITYTVTNYDAATRTITLSAPLIAAIADNTSLSIAPTSLVLGVNSGPVGNLPISPPPFTSFYYNNTLHYVVAFDAGTNQITFAPALSANIAANARLQLTTPGVTIDSRTSSIGATSYSVNSTRLQVAGTLSWNSFVEQLILNRGCPIALYGSPSPELLSVVYVTGTMNISGRRPPGWGLNSGDNSAHPAFIARTSSTTALATASGSAVNTSNCVFYSDGSIAIRLGTHSHTSVTYASDIGGRNLSEGPLFTLNGSITDIQLNGLYHSMNAIHLSGIQFNNTTALFLTRVSANASLALNLSFRNNPTPFAFASNALNPGTSSLYALNLEAGSRQNIIIVAENHPSQGGQGVFLKQVSHYCKNIANTPISSVKINAKDTLNGQHFDWFALTQNATSFPTSALGAVWDGALQKSYNWLTSSTGFTGDRVVVESGGTIGSTSLVINNGTTGQAPSITPEIRQHFTFTIAGVNYSHTITGYVSGTRTLSIIPALTVALPATTELQVNPSVILAYLCNPNRRAINVSAVAMATANIGATTVNVNNGTTALSPDLQVNGTFVVAGIRHVITAVTAITSGHQLTFTPALQAQIVASAVVAIQNLHFDYRNKTSYSAVVSVNANSGSSSLRVNNGSGLFAIAPPINTVFTYANVLYFVTAVTTNASDYTLTLFPSLQASAAVGTPITIRNVQGQDAFDFYSSSYLHLPQQQELTLTGTGTLTNNWQILDDASITQTNKATVDAYTTITTAAQFYDRAKSWWYDNFETLPASQQGAVLVTRAGTVLNAGAYNITLNNAAGAVFAFASNTITIKTATFTDTLTTTGTITLSQTGTYSAGIVPATGTVAIAAAGTYDLSGWTFASGATISNTSGEAVTVWLSPSQVANATGTGSPAPTIIAKPQPLTAPNFADGTRAYAARVQSFTIASTDINTSTDAITLGNDSQGNAAAFATAAPWTQVRFSLNSGATLPTTTGSVLKDGGFYYWSGGQLYTSLANIPSTPVDFTSQGTGNFTLLAETELFNTVVSGGAGLSQSLVQSNGIAIRLKATYWAESSGTATASIFYDSRDSLLTWSDTAGLAVGATIGPTAPETVHEAIVAASGIQSNKYGLLTPANTGSGLSQFTIALEGVGTLQINSNDTDGVELLQNIFLWWCWIRATEAGIRIASFDTLQALSFTSYQAGRVEVENINSTTPLTIAGGSITFPGTSTGIAATSYAINLNADVQGVVALTGLSAADLRSAVGLTSANLDSQLSDITALVL